MTTNSIGDRLRFLRNRFRLTQGEIADILHVSVSTYRFYENAKREPSISFLILAADYYHVSLDYLYGRTPDDFFFPSRKPVHSLSEKPQKKENIYDWVKPEKTSK